MGFKSVSFYCIIIFEQLSGALRAFEDLDPGDERTFTTSAQRIKGIAHKQTLLSYKLRWRARKHDLVGFHEFLGCSAPL